MKFMIKQPRAQIKSVGIAKCELIFKFGRSNIRKKKFAVHLKNNLL